MFFYDVNSRFRPIARYIFRVNVGYFVVAKKLWGVHNSNIYWEVETGNESGTSVNKENKYVSEKQIIFDWSVEVSIDIKLISYMQFIAIGAFEVERYRVNKHTHSYQVNL